MTEWNLRLPVEPLGGNHYTRRTEPYNPDEDDISKRPVDKFLQHYQVELKMMKIILIEKTINAVNENNLIDKTNNVVNL